MARIKEMKMHRQGSSWVVSIPKEYINIQSRHCKEERKIVLGFLYPEEIMEYETQCQTLIK